MAKSYLEITLKIDNADRANAAGVYNQYKAPFLENIKGAISKELLIRDEDVQVLHGFERAEDAQNYLSSELFNNDVVTALKPYLKDNPDVRIYTVA
ncbi:hypothetical protein H8S90_11940 [Olivibacter sp. SDN3]|uniref:hypothetical protein n=1 Tax=Olivibacter sp. SDN3 TaxID=2764720 RepID=UPI0016513F49|nr:hypothetical protein [Olivibacter sp. SDN3]QNL52215.1 hypothetical protein H8S90_11940 [Olivibacter sp. SDN3]